MARRKKLPAVSSHAGQLLVELRTRSGLSVRDVAAKIGKSRQAVHVAEKRPHHASMDTLMAFAHACGATPAELDRLPALTAMDKGALVVPSGTTLERVTAAARALLDAPAQGVELRTWETRVGPTSFGRGSSLTVRQVALPVTNISFKDKLAGKPVAFEEGAIRRRIVMELG